MLLLNGLPVQIAGGQDLDRSIGALVAENRRFIIIDKVHFDTAWPRFDSYDHKLYNTVDPATILHMLNQTNQDAIEGAKTPTAEGSPKKGSIYQCQATPTANLSQDVRASLT